MHWLIIIFAALFIFAPVRKVFFATWRFTLPAIAAFVFALIMLTVVMKMKWPGIAILAVSLYFAAVVGMECLNDIFGSNKPK